MAGCRETVSGGFGLGVRVSKAPCFFMYWQYAQKNNIFAARCTNHSAEPQAWKSCSAKASTIS